MAGYLKRLFGYNGDNATGNSISTDRVDDENQQLKAIKEKLDQLLDNPSNSNREEISKQLELLSKSFKMTTNDVTLSRTNANATQTQQMRADQVVNSAGGYSFKVCDMMRLRRFIVIGSENGSYYSTNVQLGKQNIQCIQRLIQAGHGIEVINLIKEYSLLGRVAKEEPILLALTSCAVYNCEEVQRAAYAVVPKICNIPTKLFTFIGYCQNAINEKRKSNPPAPQPTKTRKLDDKLKSLKIGQKRQPCETEDESIDSSGNLKSAKRRKREARLNQTEKRVNKLPKNSSGWGRMRRRGISKFYTDDAKNPEKLLYLMTKYKQRNNWSHKKVLGYAHPKIKGEQKQAKDLIMVYCTRGYEKFKIVAEPYRNKVIGINQDIMKIIQCIDAVDKVIHLSPTIQDPNKTSSYSEDNEKILLQLLEQYGKRAEFQEAPTFAIGTLQPPSNPTGGRTGFQLVREHIPTGFLKSVKVWEALLIDMPMTAMIRNLGKMSSIGMFTETSQSQKNIKYVVDALNNQVILKRARVHPIKILIAMKVYEQGHGDKGSLHWVVNQEIMKALNSAFHKSFQSKDLAQSFKTNKNFMLALDVSGSMTWEGCYGCENLTPAMASVAMAMITWNIEDDCEIMAFGGHFKSLKNQELKRKMSIMDAMRATSGLNFGSTDCSLPMVYALRNKIDIDCFIVYTDSDTWAGRIQPTVALRNYNTAMVKNAKLIVCAMQSNGFTIADPEDPNMMDMCGFDTSVPEIIAEFAKGGLDHKCNVCTDCRQHLAAMTT